MAQAALAKTETADTAFELYKDVPPAKTVTVKLLRNYRPSGAFEIVGYHKDPILRKRPDGKMIVIEEGGFMVEKDPDTDKIIGAPPALPGTGFADRLNANTVIRVAPAEAKRMKAEKIGEVEIDD